MHTKNRSSDFVLLAGLACVTASCAASADPRRALPDSWIAVGVQNVAPTPSRGSLSDDLGLSLEYGHTVSRAERSAWALEGSVTYTTHGASWSQFNYLTGDTDFMSESPTDWIVGAGARWTCATDSGLAPYVRGGLVYQYLYDYLIDDSGFGFYLGTGFDCALTPTLSLGPSLMYSSAGLDSFDVDTWLVGLKLSFVL